LASPTRDRALACDSEKRQLRTRILRAVQVLFDKLLHEVVALFSSIGMSLLSRKVKARANVSDDEELSDTSSQSVLETGDVGEILSSSEGDHEEEDDGVDDDGVLARCYQTSTIGWLTYILQMTRLRKMHGISSRVSPLAPLRVHKLLCRRNGSETRTRIHNRRTSWKHCVRDCGN